MLTGLSCVGNIISHNGKRDLENKSQLSAWLTLVSATYSPQKAVLIASPQLYEMAASAQLAVR